MLLKFSSFVRVGALLLGILCAGSFLMRTQPHPYIDVSGLLLIELLFLTIVLTSGSFSNKYPLVPLINLLVLLYVGTRLLILVIEPSSFLFHSRTSVETFNSTIIYIILGTASCLIGLARGYSAAKVQAKLTVLATRTLRSRIGPRISEPVLLVIFLIAVAACVGDYFLFGWTGTTGSGQHLQFLRRYPLRLLNPTMAFIIATVHFMRNRKQSGVTGQFCAIALIFLLYLYAIGGRGALLQIVVMLICAVVFFYGNFRVRLTRGTILVWPLAIVLGWAASVYLYRFVTEFRRAYWYHEPMSLNVMEGADLYQYLLEISYRLNLFESTALPLNYSELGYNDISDVANVKNTAKLIVERLIPGEQFAERPLFTEFAFGMFFHKAGPVPSDSAGNYIGYEWGMYGISRQLFGYIGGLVFICVFSGLLALACRWLRERSYSPLAAHLGVFAVWTLYEWFRNLGLDNLVDRTVISGVVLIGYVIVASKQSRAVTYSRESWATA